MVKYLVKTIASLLRPINVIPGRPMFGTLYQMKQTIINCLQKIVHPEYHDNGFSGYIMSPRAF